MERAVHRKSKSASGIEGLERIEKQRLPARRSTDSRPYVGGNKRDDMLMLHLGGSSPFRGSTGAVPMKKLLAEEMSREVEPKRRPPSLIARLMGLKGLPPLRQQRQQNRGDKGENRGPTDQTEFKDVYEDLEVSSHRRFPLRWSAGPYLTNPEVVVIRQKIIEAKRHSSGGENHIAILKPSKFEKYKGDSRSRRLEIDTRKDGLLLEPHSRHISRGSSRIQSDEKIIQEKILSTRIVVLKPNLEKKIKEYPSWKDSSRVVGLSRPISKEARELAREITMRMRRDTCDESIGYRGDESSYDASESELEYFKVPCRKSLDGNSNNIQKYSSFLLAESSVNKEARKRLSERWRMSREYRDLELRFSKGSTLGEMLEKPDSNGKKRSLGISSRDAWMDEIITRRSSSSRSKSLPPPRSRKRSTYRDDSKFVKRSLSHKEDYLSSSKYTKSRGKKPQMEVNFEIQMEADIKDIISEHQPEFKMMAKTDTCKSPVVDVMMITEPGCANMSLETSASIPKQLCSVIDGDGSAAQEKGNYSFQDLQKVPPHNQASPSFPCPGSELESSESHNKEADHHTSPISVFEVPFTADAVKGSSESFERVGAGLQELRLQLQLLKMESNTKNADASALLPIDKEEMQPSPIVSEGEYLLSQSQCWEYSYALDLLIASGLQDFDFNMFKTSWYSPDCPLDPKLFEDFEKQYINQMTGAKLERRLLFDRINSALLQISMEHFDLMCPWVMPESGGFNLRRRRRGVRDAIEKLIEQEVLLDAEVSDREMQWWDCKGEIEIIGNEIEKLLIDDFMAEAVLCM